MKAMAKGYLRVKCLIHGRNVRDEPAAHGYRPPAAGTIDVGCVSTQNAVISPSISIPWWCVASPGGDGAVGISRTCGCGRSSCPACSRRCGDGVE